MREDVLKFARQFGKTGLVTEAIRRRYDPCRPRDCPFRTPPVPRLRGPTETYFLLDDALDFHG